MRVYPEDLIIWEREYQIELYFPDIPWTKRWWTRITIEQNCKALNIRPYWIFPTNGSWFLEYHLAASGRIITHGEFFNLAIKPAYDRVIWIECIELGERQLHWLEELVEWLKSLGTDWKLIAGIMLAALVLLIIFRYGYKRGKQ